MPTLSDIVLFCGDQHGQFRHILRAAGELHASAVILLGGPGAGAAAARRVGIHCRQAVVHPRQSRLRQRAQLEPPLGQQVGRQKHRWSSCSLAQWHPDRRVGGAYSGKASGIPACRYRQNSAIAKSMFGRHQDRTDGRTACSANTGQPFVRTNLIACL